MVEIFLILVENTTMIKYFKKKRKPYKALAREFRYKIVLSEEDLFTFCKKYDAEKIKFVNVLINSRFVVDVSPDNDSPQYVMSVAAFANEQNRKSLQYATWALGATAGFALIAIIIDLFYYLWVS